MYPPAPPAPAPWDVPAARLPLAPIAVGSVLAVLATVVGLLRWPPPVWAPGTTWMVRDVPASLVILLLTTALVSLAAATVLLARATPMGPRRPATWGWMLLALAAQAALVWNALYSASLSTIDFGAIIPIFHWLFTFAPAVLVGWIFRPRGKAVCRTAALCSGVVTLPLFALSFALLWPGFGVPGALSTLALVGPLGAAPLIGGVAIAWAIGRR